MTDPQHTFSFSWFVMELKIFYEYKRFLIYNMMRQLWLIDCKLLSSKYDAYIILVYGIILMWTNILMI